MTGLLKPKTYDWKDSNLALFGSDVERQVKKEAAETEPAWQNAGTEVGLQIWRIEKFKVTHWQRDLYGKFFNGDSYIILHTYHPNPDSDELAYDLHFWIGSNSTQDEYGAAAYKTVELDTYLDDKPVQHREVEGHESELFLSYFPSGIVLMEGGADSGFHHVEPQKYEMRMFHICNVGKNIVVSQVPAMKSRLTSDDVFILDLGLTIYQWNGSQASVGERRKAMKYVQNLKEERKGKPVSSEVVDEVVDDMDSDHPFYSKLNDGDAEEDFQVDNVDEAPQLLRVSDESGTTEFQEVKTGSVTKSDFDSNDVFILATPKNCFVWIGRRASPEEKKNGFGYAHGHLMKTGNPLRPIHVVKEGQENKDFQMALAA